MDVDVAILGGGFVGAILNKSLKKHKYRKVVIEKENCAYGHCRSLSFKGYTFDIGGPHIIFSKDELVLDKFKKTLKNNWHLRARDAHIQTLNYGRIPFPFESGIAKCSLDVRLNYLESLFDARTNLNEGVTLDAWFRNAFGEWAFNEYFHPYNKKIWKRDLSLMDNAWTKDRVPLPSLRNLIASSLGQKIIGNPAQAKYVYPVKGGIEAFAKSIGDDSDYIYNSKLQSITKTRNCYEIILNQGRKIQAKKIISTISLEDLCAIYRPVPTAMTDFAQDLDYNGLITLMIGCESKARVPLAVYNPNPKDKFHRITFSNRLSRTNSPEGSIGLTLEETFPKGITPDNEVTENDSESANVVNTKSSVLAKNNLINFFENEGFILSGRLGRFEYMNMDAAYICAMKALDNLQKEMP